MERYSIALHGIDSYTKQPIYEQGTGPQPGSIPGLPAEKNKRKGENNGKI